MCHRDQVDSLVAQMKASEQRFAHGGSVNWEGIWPCQHAAGCTVECFQEALRDGGLLVGIVAKQLATLFPFTLQSRRNDGIAGQRHVIRVAFPISVIHSVVTSVLNPPGVAGTPGRPQSAAEAVRTHGKSCGKTSSGRRHVPQKVR